MVFKTVSISWGRLASDDSPSPQPHLLDAFRISSAVDFLFPWIGTQKDRLEYRLVKSTPLGGQLLCLFWMLRTTKDWPPIFGEDQTHDFDVHRSWKQTRGWYHHQKKPFGWASDGVGVGGFGVGVESHLVGAIHSCCQNPARGLRSTKSVKRIS